MAEYDDNADRLIIKLVYYGPALSGKTTNLIRLHDMLQPELKGEMMMLETRNDRTLFFDLLPVGFRAASGLLIKFKLFTVPGQVVHDSTRKAVLSRADGVVFVADSQRSQSINNGESFDNLIANTGRVGLEFERLPLVVQFNKRDLPNILSEEEVKERWRAARWPVLFSAALTGQGVIDTFEALLNQVYTTIDQDFQLLRNHGVHREAFVKQVLAGKDQPLPAVG